MYTIYEEKKNENHAPSPIQYFIVRLSLYMKPLGAIGRNEQCCHRCASFFAFYGKSAPRPNSVQPFVTITLHTEAVYTL